MARASIFFIIAALISGTIGCAPASTPQYDLTISSTEGGSVTGPGEGAFTYDEGEIVNLAADVDEEYRFINWTGDTDSIADVNAATTTIIINGDYEIIANFSPETLEIHDWYDLSAIRGNLGKRYVLMNDLDSGTAGYEELAGRTANDGEGWEPIGTGSFNASDLAEPYTRLAPFTGMFDGQGYVIRDLFIDRPDEDAVGLFGAVDEGGVVQDVGIVNARVTGRSGVGGLAGASAYEGAVSNCYASGRVVGAVGVGGLVGANGYGGAISNCYSTVSVLGTAIAGGLAGVNSYEGTVSNSYSTGSVTATMGGAGGLVGANTYQATIQNSYSTGKVTSEEPAGGLVANNWMGLVDNSFWDAETSEMQVSAAGMGKTTVEMENLTTFAGWNIAAVANPGIRDSSYIWNVVDGQTYPFLSWQS